MLLLLLLLLLLPLPCWWGCCGCRGAADKRQERRQTVWLGERRTERTVMLAVGMWAGKSKGAGAKTTLDRRLGVLGMGGRTEAVAAAAAAAAVEAAAGGKERSRLFWGMVSMGGHPPVGTGEPAASMSRLALW